MNEPRQYMTKYEKKYMLAILILGSVLLVILSLVSNDLKETDTIVGLLPTDGTPALILQNKVGDDAIPHIHQTWCQLLPYKRYINDDQVFCYVEVITDWMVE